MKKILAALLFFLFLLEGSVLQWLLPQAWGSRFVIIPQLVVSGIVSMAFWLREREVLLFGIGFGLLHDVVYGPALGIHAWTTGLVALGAARAAREFPPEHWIADLIAIAAQTIHLLTVYGWERMFDLTYQPFAEVLIHQIFPSVMFNVTCGTLLFHLISWICRKRKDSSVSLFG
jgi:rod shape-determining protein MreD